jgi:transposase
MSPHRKLSNYAKELLHVLYKKKNISTGKETTVSDIIKMKLPCLAGFSQSTIYKHATGKFADNRALAAQRPIGRPRKIQLRDERNITRAIKNLRKQYGASFTTRQLQEHTGLLHVDQSTVRKYLHKLGYRYLATRKKGLMSAEDRKKRVKWARNIKKKFAGRESELWTQSISIHADIVGFEYKVLFYNILLASKFMNPKEL